MEAEGEWSPRPMSVESSPSPFLLLLRGLDKETCLIPAVQEPTFPQSYNLVTENLALTEYTLYLGFHR